MITGNSLSANATKWANTVKQFVGNLSTNCLSVFDHFVRLTILFRFNIPIHLQCFLIFCNKTEINENIEKE